MTTSRARSRRQQNEIELYEGNKTSNKTRRLAGRSCFQRPCYFRCQQKELHVRQKEKQQGTYKIISPHLSAHGADQ